MKYTDSKNNITFNNVKEAGVYHASGPIGLNGLYTTSGANITDINSNLSLINAIDINWNGALVESGVVLNTTGDLLRWIKEHSGNSQGTNELTINNQGYWCINGVSTGVKALGENGLTPFIGSNGNWWIGTTDTGVSANTKTVTVSYLDSVGTTAPGRYTIGTLLIGNNTPITLNGINTVGEGGSSIDLRAIYDALNEKLDKDDFEGTLTRSEAYLSLNSRLGEAETVLGTKVSQNDYNSKISDLETSIAAAAAGVSSEELLRLINQAISGNYVSTSAFAEFQSTLKGSEATIEANFKKLAIEALDESEGIAKVTAISNDAFSDYITEQNLVTASTLAQYAKTTYVDGRILELTTATSGLRSRIEALENGDFVSESELLSEIDDKIASITTLVTKTDNGDGTYSIDSNIKLSADLIELDGETIIRKLSADLDNGISYNGHDGVIIDPTKLLFYSSVHNGAARSYTEINAYGIHSYEDMAGLPIESYYKPEGIELYYGYDNDRPGELIKKVGIDYSNVYFNVPTTINDDLDVNGDLNIGDSKINYYNNRLRIQSGVNIENDLILNKSLKLYNNLNEEQASIEVDNVGDLSFINKSGNNSMSVSFNTFKTLYANTIECNEVVDGTSDERIKENIVPVETNISDIANARIVNFNFIGENKTKFGSIALDWQNIFPEAVKENSKGNLTMNYGAIALGSAVTAAREIVALKEENQQLKDRLAAIEQKLEAINNALG